MISFSCNDENFPFFLWDNPFFRGRDLQYAAFPAAFVFINNLPVVNFLDGSESTSQFIYNKSSEDPTSIELEGCKTVLRFITHFDPEFFLSIELKNLLFLMWAIAITRLKKFIIFSFGVNNIIFILEFWFEAVRFRIVTEFAVRASVSSFDKRVVAHRAYKFRHELIVNVDTRPGKYDSALRILVRCWDIHLAFKIESIWYTHSFFRHWRFRRIRFQKIVKIF